MDYRRKKKKTDSAEEYFEFSNFNDYFSSMTKSIKQKDVRAKILELKGIASTLKELKNYESTRHQDIDIDALIKKNISGIFQKEGEKPLYKQLQIFGPQMLKKLMEKDVKSKSEYETLNSSTEKLQPNKLNERIKMDIDSNNVSEANIKISNVPNFRNSLSIPKEISKEQIISDKNNQNNMDSEQMMTIISNLQFFLSQNLKETLELKELIKKNETGTFSQPRNGTINMDSQFISSSTAGKSFMNPHIGFKVGEEVDKVEKKMMDSQTDRLIARINTLSKQIDELKIIENQFKNYLNLLKTSYKYGKIRISGLITGDIDFSSMRMEDIENNFNLEEKFIMVCDSIKFFENENDMSHPKKEMLLSDIEEILSIEVNDSTAYLIKLQDKSKSFEASMYENSRTKQGKKIFKSKSHEGMANSYIIQIKEKKEYLAWDLIIFLLNIKIQFSNLNLIYNSPDLIFILKNFIIKYKQQEEINKKPKITETKHSYNSKNVSKRNSISPRGSLIIENLKVKEDRKNTLESTNGQSDVLSAQFQSSKHPTFKGTSTIDEDSKSQTELNSNTPNFDDAQPLTKYFSGGKTTSPSSTDKFNKFSFFQPERNVEILDPKELKSSDDSYSHNKPSKQSSLLSINKNSKKFSLLENEQNIWLMNIKFLQKGQMYLKYGKWGKPHEKLVRLSQDSLYLEWINPTNQKGSVSEIEIKTVQRIEEGDISPYFSKKKIDDKRRKLCFSIIGIKRNLDLEASNLNIKNAFCDAIKMILNAKKESVESQLISGLLK